MNKFQNDLVLSKHSKSRLRLSTPHKFFLMYELVKIFIHYHLPVQSYQVYYVRYYLNYTMWYYNITIIKVQIISG